MVSTFAGAAVTFTVTTLLFIQPAAETSVSVYVVVVAGVAVGLDTVAEVNPADGDQI